jgi:hypothetical protein
MDELLSKFMAEFEQSNANNSNSSSSTNGGMDSMIEKLMGQMLSKEMLYQPMKDISERYPEWLVKNKSKLSIKEYELYIKQENCFKRIVSAYEAIPNDNKLIMDLMTEMNDYGQPPKDLVSDLLPNGGENIPGIFGNNNASAGAAAEADLEKLTQGCPTM